jgi:hypothetical protein
LSGIGAEQLAVTYGLDGDRLRSAIDIPRDTLSGSVVRAGRPIRREGLPFVAQREDTGGSEPE